MTTIRLLLFALATTLALPGRSALAQATPPPAAAPAPAPPYHYTFLWGLWSNQAKPFSGPRARFQTAYGQPAGRPQPGRQRLKAQLDSAYHSHRILGGAVQWTTQKPSSTR